ncbi:MAG: bifunctional methylenetetrahydrofolate dehydrogenase/methenyltetrahydrofolate cyclohydrolase FolD [Spirochaetales bacterium]|nr:bifunctional methylenetetrahydrofolate dehydrogenase/methenyltetrahydrofolate cyclohydrolase FolD [Spirochaetales bacterium]
MSKRLSGKEVALVTKAELKTENELFIEKTKIVPCLAVVLVGTDPASVSYVTGKRQACEEVGFKCVDCDLPQSTTQEELLSLIDKLNKDDSIHGILVQMPLPKQIDEEVIINNIDYRKDVDGLHPRNVGALVLNQPGFVSCTPQGVLAILDYYKIPTDGKRVVIVGRSNLVGKPLANLMMQKGRDATVTVCNTHTKDLKSITLQAEILIVASGHPHTVTSDMVSPGAVIIDVGVTRVPDSTKERGWRLCGDCDYDTCKEVASAITPVPGGVGPMTITMLMKNTLLAAKLYGKKI